MIGGVGRHGRTSRDAENLARHLLKNQGATVAIAGSVAPDLRSAMSDMLLARDGSKATSAFLHVYLSPSRDLDDKELRQAALIVLRHFDALDHPAAIVTHEKERNGGKGHRHVHLVIGRIGPDGTVLPSGFEKIRLETACRIAEYELGEPATLGRHHASAVRWLRQHDRDEVADWIEATHGPAPAKPCSAASPKKRASVERQAGGLSALRNAVRGAWKGAGNTESFKVRLAAEGLTAVPGRKPGMWIVLSGDVEVGSVDRIVKVRRADVDAFMRDSAKRVPSCGPPTRHQATVERLPNPDFIAKVDLDEIRWRAEAYAKSWQRSLEMSAKAKERSELAKALRDELTAKADDALAGSRRRSRSGYPSRIGPRLHPN